MVLKPNGKEICDSRAIYQAQTVGKHGGGGGGGGRMEGMITDMGMCVKPVDVKKGGRLSDGGKL
jgi:hypothetical protein